PNIPPEIEVILLKSLEKNPDHRYDSVSEMGRNLRLAAKASSDINSTGEIPIDLLDKSGTTPAADDRLTVPGTESVDLVSNIAKTPLPKNEAGNAAETKLGVVPGEIQDLFREGVSVPDAGSDSEMTNFDLPAASPPSSKVVNIQPEGGDGESSSFEEFGLLPQEYDINRTVAGKEPSPVSKVAPPPPPSREEMAAQTKQILETLDFDKEDELKELVAENRQAAPQPTPALPSEAGSQVELLPAEAIAPAQPTSAPEPVEQFSRPENEFGGYATPEVDIEEVEEFNAEMGEFYEGFDDVASSTAIESKVKKGRVKLTHEAKARRRERIQRRFGSVLSLVFLVLGIGLGYGLYDYFFTEVDGTSKVGEFNAWLNTITGGSTAEEQDLSSLVANQPVRENGHTRSSVEDGGVALIIPNLEELPAGWTTVIEAQASGDQWVPVNGLYAHFNAENEVVWPVNTVAFEANRLYRWRIYDRSSNEETVATSGPFVLPNEGAMQVIEVDTGPLPESE
ncbi:MAG: hypothetical protein AAF633_22365, partial [Chloroflexota bacterium]